MTPHAIVDAGVKCSHCLPYGLQSENVSREGASYTKKPGLMGWGTRPERKKRRRTIRAEQDGTCFAAARIFL